MSKKSFLSFLEMLCFIVLFFLSPKSLHIGLW
uniref:Uncharacterized protein n=1 Tax=Anguilla anguilla TaxID=7936 RepID=A0A0E9Q513_ANGAN